SSGDLDGATEVGGTKTQAQPKDPASARWLPAQLRVRHGHQESVHRLTGEAVTIGKDPGNDLVVEDPFISSRHLKLQRRDTLFQVTDRGSTNGTYLGNARIYEVEVPLFTTLRVGETELVLEPLA